MATNPELDPKLAENQQAPAVTLTVDVNELNLIMGGLQELPHRVVDGLLKKLLQQAQDQLGPPQG
tara:strand:+ start:3785 stop:3979 length:195 start_codon:yes stop_codon:yes gene_type:complete